MKKIIMLFFILLAAGCINKENKSSVENIFAEKNNWLSLPDNITYKADVFYILRIVLKYRDAFRDMWHRL